MITTLRLLVLALLCIACSCTAPATAQAPAAEAPATQPAPTTQPGQTRKLEHITVDVARKQVRVDCEVVGIDAPLEFFCVRAGGPEHETVLRTRAKPSDIHLGLLMIGLKPGRPVRYSEAANRWFPPMGPPVRIGVEFQKDGQTVRTTANRLMRNLESKQPMPDEPWIFVGSQIMDDGNYAADVTGYIISVVNFDLTVIDVPDLRSSANELLEWEADLAALPAPGTPVTMILEPVGQPAADKAAADQAAAGEAADDPLAAGGAAAGEAAADAAGPIDMVLIEVKEDGSILYNRKAIQLAEITPRLIEEKQQRPVTVRIGAGHNGNEPAVQQVMEAVQKAGIEPVEVVTAANTVQGLHLGLRADLARMQALRDRWEKAVKPNAEALRHAAQSHYEVIMSLREEQQRLIDEADKIQRLIEDLEREYQDITTPRPVP